MNLCNNIGGETLLGHIFALEYYHMLKLFDAKTTVKCCFSCPDVVTVIALLPTVLTVLFPGMSKYIGISYVSAIF